MISNTSRASLSDHSSKQSDEIPNLRTSNRSNHTNSETSPKSILRKKDAPKKKGNIRFGDDLALEQEEIEFAMRKYKSTKKARRATGFISEEQQNERKTITKRFSLQENDFRNVVNAKNDQEIQDDDNTNIGKRKDPQRGRKKRKDCLIM